MTKNFHQWMLETHDQKPTDLFGQPIQTDLFGKEIKEKKPAAKRAAGKKKQDQPGMFDQPPQTDLFGGDKK